MERIDSIEALNGVILMYKKSKYFIIALCIASLTLPLVAMKWRPSKKTTQVVGVVTAFGLLGYAGHDWWETAAQEKEQVLFRSKVWAHQWHGKEEFPGKENFVPKFADDSTQIKAAEFVDAMSGKTYVGKLLLLFKKPSYPTVYQVTKAALAQQDAEGYYDVSEGIFIPSSFCLKSAEDRATLCHEAAHAHQFDYFLYRLPIAGYRLLSRMGSKRAEEKLRYMLEYDAEKMTTDILHELGDTEALEAHVKRRIAHGKNLQELARRKKLSTEYFRESQPYVVATLDSIRKKKYDLSLSDELRKEITEQRKGRETTSWREGYRECVKDCADHRLNLSKNLSQAAKDWFEIERGTSAPLPTKRLSLRPTPKRFRMATRKQFRSTRGAGWLGVVGFMVISVFQ